jgi:hypothetical protein
MQSEPAYRREVEIAAAQYEMGVLRPAVAHSRVCGEVEVAVSRWIQVEPSIRRGAGTDEKVGAAVAKKSADGTRLRAGVR